MKVSGKKYKSIWKEKDSIYIIDQTLLPNEFKVLKLDTFNKFCEAIISMQVRGAPLIGVTSAFAIAHSMSIDPSINNLRKSAETLLKTRPTAINLYWAVNKIVTELENTEEEYRTELSKCIAESMASTDIKTNQKIGDFGFDLLKGIKTKKDKTLNILTHCNAGWLATVDWGTALSPIFKANQENFDLHVWVDETRPRNQGQLTAWELKNEGIKHTLVTDNAGGHLMQMGFVDVVIVGSDRTTLNGDVCNKIGTYLKALAAFDNNIPFYVALPCSTIDVEISDGLMEIPIENRSVDEIYKISGLNCKGERTEVTSYYDDLTNYLNPAFDVTPSNLITGLITEKGVIKSSKEEITKILK